MKLNGYGHDTRKMPSSCLTRCVIRTVRRSAFQPTVKPHADK